MCTLHAEAQTNIHKQCVGARDFGLHVHTGADLYARACWPVTFLQHHALIHALIVY